MVHVESGGRTEARGTGEGFKRADTLEMRLERALSILIDANQGTSMARSTSAPGGRLKQLFKSSCWSCLVLSNVKSDGGMN